MQEGPRFPGSGPILLQDGRWFDAREAGRWISRAQNPKQALYRSQKGGWFLVGSEGYAWQIGAVEATREQAVAFLMKWNYPVPDELKETMSKMEV